MFIFDLTNLLTLFLVLILTILVIFLSQETKRSFIVAILLFAFIFSLSVHTVQMLTLSEEYGYLFPTLAFNISIDFVFILLNFLAYLWVDDIEAKAFNKKSIDNSLDWLWKNV